MLGERADGNAVDAILGDRAQGGQVDAAGCLERDAPVERRGARDPHCLAPGGGIEIVDQDPVATGGQRLAQLLKRLYLDPQGQAGMQGARRIDDRHYRAGRAHVRSEARRVRKEWVRTWHSWWATTP